MKKNGNADMLDQPVLNLERENNNYSIDLARIRMTMDKDYRLFQ